MQSELVSRGMKLRVKVREVSEMPVKSQKLKNFEPRKWSPIRLASTVFTNSFFNGPVESKGSRYINVYTGISQGKALKI